MNFNNNEFTLLTDEQTFGNNKIDVIKKMGGKCAVSDFAILLGACVSSVYYVYEDNSIRRRTSWWYLFNSPETGYVKAVNELGNVTSKSSYNRAGCVRPILSYSNIPNISKGVVIGENGLLEVEYGEYPQYAVDTSLATTLESNYFSGRIKKNRKNIYN